MYIELQMRMNVLEVLIDVIPVQHATTRMGVTPVLATMDTQAMDFIAWVSTFFSQINWLLLFHSVP